MRELNDIDRLLAYQEFGFINSCIGGLQMSLQNIARQLQAKPGDIKLLADQKKYTQDLAQLNKALTIAQREAITCLEQSYEIELPSLKPLEIDSDGKLRSLNNGKP